MSTAVEFDTRRQSALDRVDSTIKWYNAQKHKNRILFYSCITISFIASGSSPFAVWLSNSKALQSILPAIASLLTGLLGIYQFQTNWVREALVVESLKSERHKYVTRSGDDYSRKIDGEDALERFVIRVEGIISNETSSWQQSISSVHVKDKDKTDK